MERVIPITIRDKIATAPRDALYVCGNSDYTINFTFDEEWEDFNEKTARFVFNGQYVDMIFSGNVCPVPVISNTYAFEVGVYAGNLSTTTKAYVPATKSVLCGGDVPAEPVSVYVPASELEKKADKEYVAELIAEQSREVNEPIEGMDTVIGISETEALSNMDSLIDGEPEIDPNAGNGNPVSGVSKAEMEAYVSKRLGNYTTKAEMEASVKRSVDALIASIEIAEEGAY